MCSYERRRTTPHKIKNFNLNAYSNYMGIGNIIALYVRWEGRGAIREIGRGEVVA